MNVYSIQCVKLKREICEACMGEACDILLFECPRRFRSSIVHLEHDITVY